jgi:hypothetical protein
MGTDVKLFNKILANSIPQHIIDIIKYDQVGCIINCENSLTYENQI